MGKIFLFILSFLMLNVFFLQAQFALQAPLSGHEGIHKNDSRIKAWATYCELERGWIDIADKSLGKTTYGTALSPIGEPNSQIVSLGDSGVATLTFAFPIQNGSGPDFAVFENAFADPENDTMAFLELAFVEVSSDGINFTRFPTVSLMQDTQQISNTTYSDARYYHNFAGKYIANYGTPFDLEELKNTDGLDVNHITHVRIVDVVGSLDQRYANYDSKGNIINEPYPTDFHTGGFDLNAIAVIHSQQAQTVRIDEKVKPLMIYPNPIMDFLGLKYRGSEHFFYSLHLIDGKKIISGEATSKILIDVQGLSAGTYLLKYQTKDGVFSEKITKQ